MSDDTKVVQWYGCGLTEKEAQALIGHIPGAKAYNLVKHWSLLPEPAKQVLREAYAKLNMCSEC